MLKNQIVRPVENVLVRELGEEAVVLNLNTEHYYALNSTGLFMYNILVKAESVDAAFQQILTEFEVDPAVLERDLETLIQRLQESKLIEVHEQQV